MEETLEQQIVKRFKMKGDDAKKQINEISDKISNKLIGKSKFSLCKSITNKQFYKE